MVPCFHYNLSERIEDEVKGLRMGKQLPATE